MVGESLDKEKTQIAICDNLMRNWAICIGNMGFQVLFLLMEQ